MPQVVSLSRGSTTVSSADGNNPVTLVTIPACTACRVILHHVTMRQGNQVMNGPKFMLFLGVSGGSYPIPLAWYFYAGSSNIGKLTTGAVDGGASSSWFTASNFVAGTMTVQEQNFYQSFIGSFGNTVVQNSASGNYQARNLKNFWCGPSDTIYLRAYDSTQATVTIEYEFTLIRWTN